MVEKDKLIFDHLAQFVSDHKKEFIEKVLGYRTRHITVVLEDIYQSQNASAVVRTCECMGVQDIHIIEQEAQYEINPRVLRGANKWMDLHRYRGKGNNNTRNCYDHLRERGYTILATDPAEDGLPLDEIPVDHHKIALVFGNELRGISSYGIANADHKVKIPMFGFTESMNISVSVAIFLNTLISKLHRSGTFYGLSDVEKNELRLSWYRKIVRRSDLIEREFLRTIE